MRRDLGRLVLCGVVAIAGAFVARTVPGATLGGPVVVVAAALIFWGVFAPRRVSVASGILWGAAFGFLVWLAWAGSSAAVEHLAMTGLARATFPNLVGDVIFLGVTLGLALAAFDRIRDPAAVRFAVPARAIACGGFAGLVGGWAFGIWMARVHFFPLVAGLVGSTDASVGMTLNFAIAATIGISFGVVFSGEIRGIGSSIGYGVAYGTLWWFVGALTLLPFLSHRPVDWSATHAAALFGSLVGHVIYGVVVGIAYGAVDRAWRKVFEESDPLKREPGGSLRTLGSIGLGVVASLAGGAVFSIVMFESGALPHVAMLVGGRSIAVGLTVHMIISAIIGATYGALFRYEAPDVSASLAWGLVYGAIWWFVGALTLFPVLLGQPFDWSAGAAAAQLPSLIGHLLYGAATALAFVALERRQLARIAADARLLGRELRRRRPPLTAAPTVWLLIVGIDVTLAILLT